MVSSARRGSAAAGGEAEGSSATPLDLPWLAPVVAHTLATQRSHALLVHGPAGVGQFEMALALARAWLCETPAAQRPDGTACGTCGSCHLVDERSHPDLRLLVPEALRAQAGLEADEAGTDDDGKKRKPSREIKVEQVRAAIDFSSLTAGRAALKVLLVYPAEAMNGIAANALLKTLEEPPGALRFVLASAAPQALLPTIRSRCQAVRLPTPAADVARTWLEALGVPDSATLLAASGQQPLLALDLHRGGLAGAALRDLAARVTAQDAAFFSGWPLPQVVDALQRLCHDRLLATLGLPPRYYPGTKLPAGDLARLTAWAAALRSHARHAEHPWNAGLAIEALLVEAAAVDAVDAAPIHSRP